MKNIDKQWVLILIKNIKEEYDKFTVNFFIFDKFCVYYFIN